MNLLHIVGARPNFMKAAPVMAALEICWHQKDGFAYQPVVRSEHGVVFSNPCCPVLWGESKSLL